MSQEQTKKIEYIAINDLIPYVNNAIERVVVK